MVEIINYDDDARAVPPIELLRFSMCGMISFSRRIPYQQCLLIICSEKVLNVIAFDDRSYVFFFSLRSHRNGPRTVFWTTRCALICYDSLLCLLWFPPIERMKWRLVGETGFKVDEQKRSKRIQIKEGMDRFPRIFISAKWRNIWEIHSLARRMRRRISVNEQRCLLVFLFIAR